MKYSRLAGFLVFGRVFLLVNEIEAMWEEPTVPNSKFSERERARAGQVHEKAQHKA